MTGSAASKLVGSTVGERFRLDRTLGEGGMGAVFEASDLTTGARVALKVLRPQLAREPNHLARFRREAEVTGLLAHPHIVRAVATGIDTDGTAWLAMDLVEGETLSAVLRREGCLSRTAAVGIIRQVVVALAAAHEVGVVHRDLKPANIMVGDDHGRRHVTVVDFGIARFVDSAGYEKLTATGLIIGTPSFMAPEQAFGDTIDARADIYCAGAILHVLLTGEAPFGRGRFEEVLPRMMSNDRQPLTVQRPDLGPIAEVVERCLQYEPDQRYQSALDLDRALAAFDEEKTSVVPWTRPETMHTLALGPDPVLDAPRPRRRPRTAALGARVHPTAAQPAQPPREPGPPTNAAPPGTGGYQRSAAASSQPASPTAVSRPSGPGGRRRRRPLFILALGALAAGGALALVVVLLGFFSTLDARPAEELVENAPAPSPAATLPVELGAAPTAGPPDPPAGGRAGTEPGASTADLAPEGVPERQDDEVPGDQDRPLGEPGAEDVPARPGRQHSEMRGRDTRATAAGSDQPDPGEAGLGFGIAVTISVDVGPLTSRLVRQHVGQRTALFRSCVAPWAHTVPANGFGGTIEWSPSQSVRPPSIVFDRSASDHFRRCFEFHLAPPLNLPLAGPRGQRARIRVRRGASTTVRVR